MSHHTPVPYFPANLSAYAPWVATHGLVAPYGECQCGCGQSTSIASKTDASKGKRKGCPARFIVGHNARHLDLAPDGFRTCTKCAQTKPLSAYTLRSSGLSAGRYETWCRECKRNYSRAYRATSPDYRKRLRENMRAWRKRNSEHHKQYMAKRRASYKEAHREQSQRGRLVNPLREKAHAAVRQAVRRGDFPPVWTMVCEVCQEAQGQEYHHHMGYDPKNWLVVKVTCVECHGKEHWMD